MRKTVIVVHRWVALIVGVVLLGIAASGAALVFEGAIDRGLHPELDRVDRDVHSGHHGLLDMVEFETVAKSSASPETIARFCAVRASRIAS